MSGKIGAALAMPVVVAATVGAVLFGTHHTTLPKFAAIPGPLPSEAPVQKAATCMGKLHHFPGIAVPNQSSQFSTASYQTYTAARYGMLEFYNHFPGPFDEAAAFHAVRLKAMPLIQLNPGKLKPEVLRQIGNGYYDDVIKKYAEDVAGFKYCVVISFGHEMNGWWYRWGRPWNTPATFIKAWRHIHAIFAAAGATNVIWSFDPSHQYQKVGDGKVGTPAAEWYPGSQYVDMIGLDGYLQTDNNGGPQNFHEIFGFQLGDIKKFAPDKPVYLAETGVAPGPDAVSQIADLFSGLKANNLAGLVWFDGVAKHDYRLGINAAENSAYLSGLTGFLKKP